MKNYYKGIGFITILLFYFFGYTSLENYLKEGKYQEAEKYVAEQRGEEQTKSFNTLADAYFVNKKYEKSAEYYEKAGINDELKKVADIYFSNNDYDKSIDLYIKAGELRCFTPKTVCIIIKKAGG